MLRPRGFLWVLLALAVFCPSLKAEDRPEAGDLTQRVYGEWRIHVRPDRGPAYDRLIEQNGLPLFRAAGGRMVGWWKTLVGDLYEHLTIWEYDDMAAFEKAIQTLSKDPAFARFVAARDPLLAGEDNRFLRLASGAERPKRPESAAFIVHDVHRVPLARRQAYLDYMTSKGLPLLKAQGLRPVGPWVVEVGRWSEITYLYRFDSLSERERLLAEFAGKAEARAYQERIREFADEVTTRLLVPAPFATENPPTPVREAALPRSLPHRQELAPGVFAAGFSDRTGSANCGWVGLEDKTLLIDLPRGMPVAEFLDLVAATTGKPARALVLTNLRDGDVSILRALIERGLNEVFATPRIRAGLDALDPAPLKLIAERTGIGGPQRPVEILPLDESGRSGAAAVYLPVEGVLFAGPLVVHGPRAVLSGRDTDLWIADLRRLETLAPARVVPGFGSWGDAGLLGRQRRFLTELRRQVGYHVAQGRPLHTLRDAVRLPVSELVWMPYDTPTDADLEYVYKELTVPAAPFRGRVPDASDPRPHALVLLGDQPHEPGHLEEGLRPVFEATGVVPHITVDVRALTAENLAKVQLLVILRDGLQRPDRPPDTHYIWMTPEQERAVASFVESGGGFLNLHNAMGLYPKDGSYLNLVGGRYIGHGPLERFRVEVVDANHPITRGVGRFFVADEQHTPPYDEGRVHLLLRNRSDDGKSVAAAGWVREPGRGRVCHLANGHTREALLHPMFQTLLRNAVQWCLRRDDAGLTESARGD